MTARAKLYVREIGPRGHVLVGLTTAQLGRLERVEYRAFSRMVSPGSLATFNVRRDRWKKLRKAVNYWREQWARVWGIA